MQVGDDHDTTVPCAFLSSLSAIKRRSGAKAKARDVHGGMQNPERHLTNTVEDKHHERKKAAGDMLSPRPSESNGNGFSGQHASEHAEEENPAICSKKTE